MILLSFGTRPEYIKIDPLIREFKEQNIPFETLMSFLFGVKKAPTV